MDKKESEYIYINNDQDLDYLLERINDEPGFARKFKFDPYNLRDDLLNRLGVSVKMFDEKNFIFDTTKNLHIAESEQGYLWISTMGLVVMGDQTDNRYFNSCQSQYATLLSLLDKALEMITNNESIYDIDSYSYDYLNRLNSALFNNLLFYFELFGKAYLDLSNIPFPQTHKLSKIFSLVRKAMFKQNHNDTQFHVYILYAFEQIVKYINTLPESFKEQYVKYHDNTEDFTVIDFNYGTLNDIKNTIELSYDFISNYYYDKEDKLLYLQQGLYDRLINMATNEEDKQRLKEMYGFLTAKE